MAEGDRCTTSDGRSGYMISTGRVGEDLLCVAGDSVEAARKEHAAISDRTAPVQTETMTERIARIKREGQVGESGEGGAQTSGLAEVKANRSTTAGSATRDAADPQDAARRPLNETNEPTPGSTGEGRSTSISRDESTSQLGTNSDDVKLQDGTATGERARESATGIVPESNDVMLGDQSSRKDGPKPRSVLPELKSDGSKSPHDATSEGGSRQAAGHEQEQERRDARVEENQELPPAFRAEAKERTI